MTMLRVVHLAANYGPAPVLFDISFEVGAGEVVTLLGRNGMGKTTTIRTVMGLVATRAGAVSFDGISLTGRQPFQVAQAGLGLVPEGRQIFPTLSVEENLVATAAARFGPPRWTAERVYAFFPRLAERRRHMGNQLSGGEQQMLAIGRALMGNPTLLLMDEPLEGLAPVIVDALLAGLDRLKRENDLALLLVEQHAQLALELVPDAIVLDRGQIVYAGVSRDLLHDSERIATLMGVAARSAI
jgi:branched-chain amino acid transport system ATP-binding protein